MDSFYLTSLNNFQLPTLVCNSITVPVAFYCTSPPRLWASHRAETVSDSPLGPLPVAQCLTWGKHSINFNEWMKTSEVILLLNCFSWTSISRLSTVWVTVKKEKDLRERKAWPMWSRREDEAQFDSGFRSTKGSHEKILISCSLIIRGNFFIFMESGKRRNSLSSGYRGLSWRERRTISGSIFQNTLLLYFLASELKVFGWVLFFWGAMLRNLCNFSNLTRDWTLVLGS